jgi:TonB-linked SusC/RagA family outer membrane protein
MDLASHLAGKVTGALGAWNYHGLGNSITVVDGVIREARHINIMEIEQVTVLKDAYSRMLYGADGDVAVVLVTTKSGAKLKKELKFNFEQGLRTAISKPNFLDAATYMETYNKAFKSDGNTSLFYRQGTIDSTRNNSDPVLYPNSDYWGADFVNNTANFTNFYSEASGGDEKVQYFMNLGWQRYKGMMALPENDGSNVFNLRGKVDFKVNDWLKMKADIVAIFDFYKGPQSTTFYNSASTLLPNSFPLLIDTSRVLNLSTLSGKNPVGNSLLGGTNVYQQNLYGDMVRGGNRSDVNRFLQYMVGFDINLEKLTKGLKLTGLADLDFNNSYSQFINDAYAIYQVGTPDVNKKFNLTKIGVDRFTTSQTVNNATSSFSRSVNGHLTANYDRIFGKHQISAVALGYYSQTTFRGVVQDVKRLRFGGQANYTYDNKYILEGGLLTEASNKMAPDSRYKTVPSFGAAWILSNEDFMKDNGVVDYLKLRGSYGEIVNDNWSTLLNNYQGYFLYEPNYATGGNFTYNNNLSSNGTQILQSLGNSYNFQTRKELVIGFDAYFFSKKLWVESSYWNSISGGNMTFLDNQAPSTIGLIPVGNYNDVKYQGVELGLNYIEQLGALKMDIGVNYIYSQSTITKWEEPVYPAKNAHLSRVGNSNSSLWGLTDNGLYSSTDFQADGKTLVAGLPKPSYGVVRPGDIKYKDVNGDNVINSDDQTVLGLGGNNQQISLNIDLNYENWQLFILGAGSWGGKGYKNSNYYWFSGNRAKYSEVALDAYDPATPDPNAEYPRLSLGNGDNNYRNSTFWMYDRSIFSLSAVQLGYNFDLPQKAPLKSLKLYLRGSNLLSVGKNVDIMQLNVYSAPQSRSFAVGLIANF